MCFLVNKMYILNYSLNNTKEKDWTKSCCTVAPLWLFWLQICTYFDLTVLLCGLHKFTAPLMNVLPDLFFFSFYRYEASKKARLPGQQPSSQGSGATGGRKGGRWGGEEGVASAQGQTRAPSKQQQSYYVPGVQHSAELQRPGPDPLQREDAPEEAAPAGKGC